MTQMRHNADEPLIGITMGEPGGIGAEVVVKALADPEIRTMGRYVVYGMNELLAYAADYAEIEPFWWRVPHDSDLSRLNAAHRVVVLDYDEFGWPSQSLHQPTRIGGQASGQFVQEALEAATDPKSPMPLEAIVTGPISKKSWSMAGLRYPGHTEFFAKRTMTRRYAMMFLSPKLRVVLATIHLPLMDVRTVLSIGKVFDAIDLGHQGCVELGIDEPRIAVCGLNPHASEDGLFGAEEANIISPAISMAREQGICVEGPFPSDTIFNAAVAGRYDLVVAMYHDQGLIPVKLLGFDEAVNVTLGLPIVRTSVDHGTAFDIAGRNKANADSMKAAIRAAVSMAQARRNS